jgi:hypothetical protein
MKKAATRSSEPIPTMHDMSIIGKLFILYPQKSSADWMLYVFSYSVSTAQYSASTAHRLNEALQQQNWSAVLSTNEKIKFSGRHQVDFLGLKK